MSISNEVVKTIYTGDDANTTFAIPFDYEDESTVNVVLRDESVTPATESTQVLGVDYTLPGSPATDVEMSVAPASTEKLLVSRTSPNTQAAVYPTSGPFPAATNETAMDNTVRQTQENKEKLSRALLLRETTSLSDLELPQPVANEFLRWNATADAIVGDDAITTDAVKATQVEAETGTDNLTFMTPLRTVQSITYNAQDWVDVAQNVGLLASVGSNILTIDLKQRDGSTDPGTGAGKVRVPFRSSTATTGGYEFVDTTGALSLAVPNTATLGTFSGEPSLLYVYLMNNAGTAELAISHTLFNNNEVQSSTTIGTGSDTATVMYSTTGRSNLPVRLIGTVKIEEATAGTWATAPTNVTAIRDSYQPSISELFTSWTSYSLTIGATTTPPTKASAPDFDGAYWRRVGDSVEFRYTYYHTVSAGSADGSGSYVFPYPTGLVPDITKIEGTESSVVGPAQCIGTATGTALGIAALFTANNGVILNVGDETIVGTVGFNFVNMNQAAVRYSFTATIPIQGWHF